MLVASYAIAPRASRSGLTGLPRTAWLSPTSPEGHSLGTPSSLIDFVSTRSARSVSPWAKAGDDAVVQTARAAAGAQRRPRRAERRMGGLDAVRRGFVLYPVFPRRDSASCIRRDDIIDEGGGGSASSG